MYVSNVFIVLLFSLSELHMYYNYAKQKCLGRKKV